MQKTLVTDEEKLVKLIKNLGMMIILYSSYMTLINLIPMFAFRKFENMLDTSEFYEGGLGWLLEYFVTIAITVVILGSVNIVGGIYLLKYRNWARVLLISTSVMITLGLVAFSFIFYDGISRIDIPVPSAFIVGSIVAGCATSGLPFFVLMYYLLQKRVAEKFI